MTKMIRLVIFALCCLTVAACSSSQNTQNNNEPYQRKIYLTEQDYLDDLAKSAELERREAKPAAESEYIFDILPETQKNVYFFDERVQPWYRVNRPNGNTKILNVCGKNPNVTLRNSTMVPSRKQTPRLPILIATTTITSKKPRNRGVF